MQYLLGQFALGHRLAGGAKLRHNDLFILEVGGVGITLEEPAAERHT